MKAFWNSICWPKHKFGFLIVLVVLLFASCQPAYIIPDEARKVTVSFEQGEVIPPPRNTNDLIELLKSKKAPVKAAIVKARAEKQPPATQDPKIRYSFFSERASSAFIMGRVLQAVSDREKAAFYAQKGYGDTSEEYSKALWYLANLCEDTMEIDKAISTMISSLNALPSSRRTNAGWNNEFQRYVFIARCSAWIGDYSMAEDYLKKAESALNVHLTAQSWPQEKISKMKCRILGPKIGILHGQGKYRDAELLRREKLAYYKDFKSDFNRALDLYYLSDTLYQQGRFVESEMEARKGLNAMFKHGGSSSFPSIAYLIYGVARPILASGRYEDAEKLARTALEIFNEIGASDKTLPKASLYAILIEALFLQDRWEEAAEYLQIIFSNFSMDSPIFLIELKARAIWFAISSKFPLTEASLQEAEKTEALFIRREGQESIHAKQAIGLQALLLESMGKHAEALERFRKIRLILVGEDRKLQFSGTENRTDAKIWKTIGESYLKAMENDDRLKVSGSIAEESFLVCQWLSTSSVDQSIAQASARYMESKTELGNAIRKLQDLQLEKKGLNNTLNYNYVQNDVTRYLLKNIMEKNQRIRTLQDEINLNFPEYVNILMPKAANFGEIQQILNPSETLVFIYTAENQSYVWGIPNQGAVKFRKVPMTNKEIANHVERIRASVTPNGPTLNDIPSFDINVAYQLYNNFLKPIESTFQMSKHLVLIKPGRLGMIPFSMLPVSDVDLNSKEKILFKKYQKVPWLIKKCTISSSPSVGIFKIQRGQKKSIRIRKPFIGFGAPVFSELVANADQVVNKKDVKKNTSRGLNIRSVRNTTLGSLDKREISLASLARLAPLPDTADEVKQICKTLGADEKFSVFLGVEANEERVKNMKLNDRRFIVFATHGLIPGDLDGLSQPAIALSSPIASKTKGDGLLTMGEIFQLKLDADWIVLSACNTASGEKKGAEAISGLGRAFFYAGARALLITHWAVETTSAKKLTTGIFKNQQKFRNISRAGALQKSIVELIASHGMIDEETGKIVASYAHPMFWAPFIIVGDSGGGTN